MNKRGLLVKAIADYCITEAAYKTTYGNWCVDVEEIKDVFGLDPRLHEDIWKEVIDEVVGWKYCLDYPYTELDDNGSFGVFADMNVSAFFTEDYADTYCEEKEDAYDNVRTKWEEMRSIMNELGIMMPSRMAR